MILMPENAGSNLYSNGECQPSCDCV